MMMVLPCLLRAIHGIPGTQFSRRHPRHPSDRPNHGSSPPPAASVPTASPFLRRPILERSRCVL